MDCSPPGSSVHGTLRAGILEWAAVPSSRGSSPPRDQTQASYFSCTGKWVFWPQAPPGKTHKYLLLWKRELDKEQPGQRCPIPVAGRQPTALLPTRDGVPASTWNEAASFPTVLSTGTRAQNILSHSSPLSARWLSQLQPLGSHEACCAQRQA